MGASNPAVTNTGTYEKWSTTQPVPKIKIIEPMPAPVPPKPATDATALSEEIAGQGLHVVDPNLKSEEHKAY